MTPTPGSLAGTIKTLSLIDIVLTAPLAIPGISQLFLQVVAGIDHSLGFDSAISNTNAMGLLLMNTTGVMAFFWCIARIRMPNPTMGWLDVYARFVVAALVLGYVGLAGVSIVFLLFLATEVVGALVEIHALRRHARESRVV